MFSVRHSFAIKAVLSAALMGILALNASSAHAQIFAVNQGTLNLGSLNISTYVDTTAGANTGENIIGNFGLPAAPAAAAAASAYITSQFPDGLTYMQTATFNFNSGRQQLIFTRNDAGFVGTALVGTFPDPPQNGYRLADGTTSLAGDTTPWYSTITPTAGSATPPNSFGANQFQDTPTLPYGMFGGQNGITGLLNGMAGTLTFETALVGVNGIPANLSTGRYQATVLEDITWGFSWNAAGVNTPIPLVGSSTASASFKSAFDRQGPNGPSEWIVAFTPEPGPVTLLLSVGCPMFGFVYLRRRKSKKVAA